MSFQISFIKVGGACRFLSFHIKFKSLNTSNVGELIFACNFREFEIILQINVVDFQILKEFSVVL